jgi:hypothetical protein
MMYDQIDRMLRQANPVHDVASLEPVDTSVSSFDTPRRTAMETNGRVTVGDKPEKPKWILTLGIAAAALVVIVVLMVAQTGKDAPIAGQPEDEAAGVVGFWLANRYPGRTPCGDLTGWVLQLAPDGTFYSWIDFVGMSLITEGTYETNPSTLTFTRDRVDHRVVPTYSWVWETSIDEATGNLDVHVPEAYDRGNRFEPSELVEGGTECSFVRGQSPTTMASSEAGWRLPTSSELSGGWMLENGPAGIWLSLDGNTGTYDFHMSVDRMGTLRQGTFRILEDGTLQLTSAGQDSCQAGDSWVWTNLQFSPGMPGMPGQGDKALSGIPSGLTGTVSQDDCGRGLGPDLIWLRVYH